MSSGYTIAIDTFPDSDFYGGATNVKGSKTVFQYGLMDNVVLGLNYYFAEPINGDVKDKDHLFQADVVFSF